MVVNQTSVKISEDYTVSVDVDIIYVDSSDSAITITIETPFFNSSLIVKDLGKAGTNNITIASTQEINSLNGFVIDKDFDEVEFTYEPIEGVFIARSLKVTQIINTVPFESFDTAVALADLNLIITDIEALTVTDSTHAATFGSETLNAGVYTVVAAITVTGILTLSGGGDPNAVFVIRSNGAINTTAGASIVLTNSASAENVHWVSGGAIPLGAGTDMIGNLISKIGEVSVGDGCTLTGRALTKSGALSSDNSILSKPSLTSFNIDYRLLKSFILFSGNGAISNVNAASSYTGDIATNLGAVTNFGIATVVGTIYPVGVTATTADNLLPSETGNPLVFKNADIVTVSHTSAIKITGFDSTGFKDKQKFLFINLGAGDFTFEKISGSSLSDNRIAIDSDVTIKQYGSIYIMYVIDTLNKWILISN
jgi:hypothetical protein